MFLSKNLINPGNFRLWSVFNFSYNMILMALIISKTFSNRRSDPFAVNHSLQIAVNTTQIQNDSIPNNQWLADGSKLHHSKFEIIKQCSKSTHVSKTIKIHENRTSGFTLKINLVTLILLLIILHSLSRKPMQV